MTIENAILKNVQQLSSSAKQAVLLYTEFLMSRSPNQKINETVVKSDPKNSWHSNNETFQLPLPKEFDLPEELMSPAQQAALEEKYGYGSLAGKLTMSDDFDEPLDELKDYM